MKLSGLVLGAAALTAMAVGPAFADDISDRISDARTKYEAGDFSAAIQDLGFASAAIQKAQGEAYAKTMPEPPSGWTADTATSETMPMMGGGVTVKRTYTREGEGRVEASILADNPMIQGMMAAFANPMIMASQPNTKVTKINGQDAIVEWRPDDKGGKVTLVVGGRLVIQMDGSNIDSADAMTDILKAWDLAALKKAAGISG